MAAFKLPRLKANLAIVDARGKPLDYFLRLFNIDLAQRLEEQERIQNEQIETDQMLIQRLDQQLVLINEALELAGIAIQQAGDKSGSAEGMYAVNAAGWTIGPVVSLSDVVAGNLTIQGTGLQAIQGQTTQNKVGQYSGEVRLVEIVGGVETVLSSSWFFQSTRTQSDPAITPYIENPAQIPGFSSSRSDVGDVSYRLDARAESGFSLANVKLYIFARRAAA